jgi:error-prone DNA polymerase
MMGVRGRVQREGEVVHIVVQHLTDLSHELASIGSRECRFPLPHGRGDEFHHGSPPSDPRGLPKPRNMPDPYLHLDEITMKPRNFR